MSSSSEAQSGGAGFAPAVPPRQTLYRKPPGVVTRWSSFENLNGIKGAGAKSNRGGKGFAYDTMEPGETRTLLDVKGSGLISRMWFTHGELKPEGLRSLRLEMYWDDAPTPAVSVPFGDFFGAILGRLVAFDNELFCNAEGRSFNCYIPMPFRKAARITITNETDRRVNHVFFDINFLLGVQHEQDAMYFHAIWRRENPTVLGQDFEILPRVEGAGRFLGSHVGIVRNQQDLGWWGEGETKVFLDGDQEHPTLVGTGTEDYAGAAWGLGKFVCRYQGSLVADDPKRLHTFYRYHIPDPIYFDHDVRVTLQQMGGTMVGHARKLLEEGAPILPVTLGWCDPEAPENPFHRLQEPDCQVDPRTLPAPDNAWMNYYRQDDVSACAYFYLDRPENSLPPLAPREERIKDLLDQPEPKETPTPEETTP